MRAFIWSKALKATEARGAILFYLTAYSPDLNPIEQLFAKLKSMLRKIAAYFSSEQRTPSIVYVRPSPRL
jgi:transposase